MSKSGRFFVSLIVVFVGAAVGSFFFLLLGAMWASNPIHDSIISAHEILFQSPHQHISTKDLKDISRLVQGGYVLPAQDILAQISDYYTTIINLILAIMAALSLISYMYIKGVSEEKAEEIAKKKVSEVDHELQKSVKSYFESKKLHDQLGIIAEEKVSPLKAGVQSLMDDVLAEKEEAENIAEIEKRIQVIEAKLAELDKEEQQGSDLILLNGR